MRRTATQTPCSCATRRMRREGEGGLSVTFTPYTLSLFFSLRLFLARRSRSPATGLWSGPPLTGLPPPSPRARTTPGRPGWALPTDSSVTYYQRTTPDLRDESQSEGVRRGGNSPEHEAPTPRYSISSTSWTVCPLVIRYYLPLACRAQAGGPPPLQGGGGGGGKLSALEHTLPTCW